MRKNNARMESICISTRAMTKYKITWERKQRGKKLDYKRETEIESSREPKVGEGRMLLVEPPIHEYISKVERVG